MILKKFKQHFLKGLNVEILLAEKRKILEVCEKFLKESDEERLKNSESLEILPSLSVGSEIPFYLNVDLPMPIARVISQIRLTINRSHRIR